jgi:hypothetical protein
VANSERIPVAREERGFVGNGSDAAAPIRVFWTNVTAAGQSIA